MVNGPSSHPLFQYLKANTDHLEIAWNFVKFLVVNGVPAKRYHTSVRPKNIEPDIAQYISFLSERDL
jgi:glutathione peroxidase-family protein